MLSNYEKWMAYNDSLPSPDSYISWGWRFIISAALQRRIAFGSDPKNGYKPLFPNMYGILYGPPGTGKSLVLDTVSDFLKFHKKKDFNTINAKSSDQEKLVIEKVEQANLEDAEATNMKLKRGGEKVDATLFPYAPDATTYEALVEAMSKAGRRINFTYTNGTGEPKLDIYFHCSMYFCLDELGSLFRKKADSTIHYINGLHGCPLDYEYKTKTNGEDRVRRGCLNFLAGTTPDFMEEISNDKLIGTGFAARCLFICATKNRKNSSRLMAPTEEQAKYRTELLAHIKNLAKLYGEVKLTPDAAAFLDDWWNTFQNNPKDRINKSPKLEHYYVRKLIHVYKVAMANHFGENDYGGIQNAEMFIDTPTVVKAIEDLNKEEPTMHLALQSDTDNPLAKVTDKVYNYICERHVTTMADLVTDFWKSLPNGKKSMEDVLMHLVGSGKIAEEQKEEPTTKRPYINYKAL
jgi:hypothetical protein